MVFVGDSGLRWTLISDIFARLRHIKRIHTIQ